MRYFIMILILTLLTGCAANGRSTYDYQRNADGSVSLYIDSVNQVDKLFISFNRTTGELEIDLGGLTKKSDTVEILESVRGITSNITAAILNPTSIVGED